MSFQPEQLQAGVTALKQGNFTEAVASLEQWCQHHPQPQSPEHLQAQMWLVKAYEGNGQRTEAIALIQELIHHDNLKVKEWAEQALRALMAQPTPPTPSVTPAAPNPSSQSAETVPVGTSPLKAHPPTPASEPEPTYAPDDMTQPLPTPSRPTRAAQVGVALTLTRSAGKLALASGVTVALLLGMVLVLILALTLILGSDNPVQGLGFALVITILFNAAVFFLSPLLMDLMQHWLYGTRWVSLDEIQRHSPETVRVIERVCAERKLKQPRLGLIDDQNPTAFTYGSLPNTARLVVSQGLFTYLDDDEIATVYAHELGHIVHWDFAVMTLAATLVQITYLIYITARELGQGRGDNKAKDALAGAAIAAYVFYIVGTYMLLYLSRTREYFADHFAAQTTGNPNALSRALVKIAYGILEEGERQKQPSKLVEGTRALGIYDPRAATSTGTAYRVAADTKKIGRVFLWDMFNPWGWWMELNSTHPLTGKRVRALSTYAEQLGLEIEFDMGRIMAEGRTLSKSRLYGHFFLDLFLYWGAVIGAGAGLLLGLGLFTLFNNPFTFLVAGLLGFGIGSLLKTLVMYPNFNQAPATDVLTLMSDPYASPLRGQPVQLQGQLIGRGDAGYVFGSDLKLQDRSGLMYLRYVSRFGSLGNFLFGWTQVKTLIGEQVTTMGWFRRGIAPWMDLIRVSNQRVQVDSYPRFWAMVIGIGSILLSLLLFPLMFAAVA